MRVRPPMFNMERSVLPGGAHAGSSVNGQELATKVTNRHRLGGLYHDQPRSCTGHPGAVIELTEGESGAVP